MKRSFTLVELLISVAILGFGLLVVIQSYLNALNGLDITQNYIEASRIASEKINEFELAAAEKKGISSHVPAVSGVLQRGRRSFNWSAEINEIAEPEYLAKNFVEACVKVDWVERSHIKTVETGIYLARSKEDIVN